MARALREAGFEPVSTSQTISEEDLLRAGPPLALDALAYAPVNELGVVFAFGMLARQLGFRVLSIQQQFPDCEAMYEVRPGIWQRVRIEFEFESRNFHRHRHHPGG